MDVIDHLIKSAHSQLIPFNRELLIDYREQQVKNSAAYIDNVYMEAMKLLGDQVKYLGYTLLSPEDRLNYILQGTKNRVKTVDVLTTDLSIFRFDFEFENQLFHSYMHLPFLRNHAIMISDSKYYLQLVIADNLFFYIQDGVGIKVMRGPIKFWRNLRYSYVSIHGRTFIDDIITTQVHFAERKGTKKDLKTTLLLYLLIYYGLYGTLDLFKIPREWVSFVKDIETVDNSFEYFKIRGVVLNQQDHVPGFYIRIKKALFDTGTPVQKRVISSLMYNMQYFDKCNSSLYHDNDELIEMLSTRATVYKIILGKTVYGMEEKEDQAINHANQHLDKFDESYIDALTQKKLQQFDLGFIKTTHDLFHYIFVNIDKWIVNQVPMNLYGKRIVVNEILLSGIVEAIFRKVYAYTKHKRPLTQKEFAGIIRAGTKEITKIFNHDALVRTSVQQYHDNYLITIGANKTRATGSGNGNISSSSKGKKHSSKMRNATEQREFSAHSSMIAVESTNSYPAQNPGASGKIGTNVKVHPITGVILEADYQQPLRVFDTYVRSK